MLYIPEDIAGVIGSFVTCRDRRCLRLVSRTWLSGMQYLPLLEENSICVSYRAGEGCLEAVEWLVMMGGNIRACYDLAIKVSVKTGRVRIVQRLIEMGADIRSNYDEAFMLACRNGHRKMATILLQNGTVVHTRGLECLIKACARGHLKIVKLLLDL